MKRNSRILAAIALLIVPASLVAYLVWPDNGGNSNEERSNYQDEFPVLQTMEQGTRDRYIAALEQGNLAPELVHQATRSFRSVSEQRCTGEVLSATGDGLTLRRMLDGAVWTIGVGAPTKVSRGGVSIEPDALREGEVVEALSQDGVTADMVMSFSEPLP